MDLFKVTLRQKKIVTVYDSKGAPASTSETWVLVTHSDLPPALMVTYKRQFPDNVVSVERQEREIAAHGARRTSARSYEGGRRTRDVGARAASEALEAPMVGSYADAVTAAVKREARA